MKPGNSAEDKTLKIGRQKVVRMYKPENPPQQDGGTIDPILYRYETWSSPDIANIVV
jgi:hypothetical protein